LFVGREVVVPSNLSPRGYVLEAQAREGANVAKLERQTRVLEERAVKTCELVDGKGAVGPKSAAYLEVREACPRISSSLEEGELTGFEHRL
jgi:hypothetical protein